jgi:enoyl-CoA hydratase
MSVHVEYEKRGPVALVRLDRPAARNALTPRMLCELADAFVDVARDDAIRVAVLAATGDAAFCAGGDLGTTLPLLTGARQPENPYDRRLLEDPTVMAASSLRGFPLHKPVVAAINGACLAAGMELMLGTDIRLAAEHATFGLPEVRRGLIPFAGSMARLPRQIPQAVAMHMLLTGEPLTATQALQWGLINRIVPLADLPDAAMEVAEGVARNGPLAVQAVKRTVIEASGVPLELAYRLEEHARERVLASEDAREGPRAFMEKRSPVYTGR